VQQIHRLVELPQALQDKEQCSSVEIYSTSRSTRLNDKREFDHRNLEDYTPMIGDAGPAFAMAA
jgi:hypothetical protein